MSGDLSTLERKLDQFIERCGRLRDENRDLRMRVAGLEAENRTLGEKIDGARARLEALMERLPES